MANQHGLTEIPQETRELVLRRYRVDGLGLDKQAALGGPGRDLIRRILTEAGVERMPVGNQRKGTLAKNGKKVCRDCGLEKDLSGFGTHHTSADHLRPDCKSCHVAESHWGGIKRRYGMNRDDYYQRLLAQNGVCACCKQPEDFKNRERLSVDHCHETGVIRGLLCHRCNIAVGLLHNSPELCAILQAYLLATPAREQKEY